MGVEHGSGTDTRTETDGKPPSSDRPTAPPPDNPGAPGQPSRLESRTRARGEQQDNESRPAEPKDTGTQTPQDRQPATRQPETGNEERSQTERPGPPAQEDRPRTDLPGSPGQPSRLESLARARGETPQSEQRGTETGEAIAKPESPGQQEAEGERRDSATQVADLTGEHENKPLSRRDGPELGEAGEPRSSEQTTRDADEPFNGSGEPQTEQARQTEEQPPLGPQEARTDRATDDHATQPTRDAEQIPYGATGEAPSQPETRPADLGLAAPGDASGEQPTGGQPAAAPERNTIDQPTGPHESRANSDTSDSNRQRTLGGELAELADKKVNLEIDNTLDKVNPKFDWAKSAYSENCTGVVQANELRRRGSEVEAGPLERNLRTDEGGPGGRRLQVIEQAWGRRFTPGSQPEIEEAFKQPGSRGIVYIAWSGPGGGAHVFNVENVGGKVRFVDGQPNPSIQDASHYFARGVDTKYLRVDDLPTPRGNAIKRFLEP